MPQSRRDQRQGITHDKAAWRAESLSQRDPEGRYPTLRSWLDGAGIGHPWIDLVEWPSDPLLAPMERILSAVQGSGARRLQGRRKAFRTDVVRANQLNLRFELLVAAKLAEANVLFEFGDEASPDLACLDPRAQGINLEATTRARDDIALLEDEIVSALDGAPVSLVAHLARRRVVIGAGERQEICSQIRQDCRQMLARGAQRSRLDLSAGFADITAGRPAAGESVSVIIDDPDLRVHLAEVEREIRNVINKKVDQVSGGAWPSDTVLVIDLSRLHWARMRPLAGWDAWLTHQSLWDGGLPFTAVFLAFSSLGSSDLGGACVGRPGLQESHLAALNVVMAAYGIRLD